MGDAIAGQNAPHRTDPRFEHESLLPQSTRSRPTLSHPVDGPGFTAVAFQGLWLMTNLLSQLVLAGQAENYRH